MSCLVICPSVYLRSSSNIGVLLMPVFGCIPSRYIPPLLWGKSGHIQTVLYGKMGRVATPKPCGVRNFLPMEDGATMTFDIFEALGEHSTQGKIPFLEQAV